MLSTRYQNSECDIGNYWLHDYRQIDTTKTGIVERCTRCGKKQHFPHDIPNHVYLSHHIRSALQINDPLYEREYTR